MANDAKCGIYEKNKNAPAKACNNANKRLTVFVGILPKSLAPKNPPAVTPSDVGINTE